MRKILTSIAAIATLGSIALAANVGLASEQQPSTKPVQLNVTCGGGNVQVSVSPWERELVQGDTVQWRLAGNADANGFSIEPKQGNRWAYSDAPPYRGTKTTAAEARTMKQNQSGQRYSYNITLTCQQGESGPYTVIVDPDIVIR